ncbi:MAG: Adenylosuccinate lyase [Alphaproteobacteria bacterium MarineAlpha5_Bin6]|nr:MAG: Adenylosuccinate lyase [Alphaproteobacteria bacterium MarineAlpha5_Bin7]PPR54000.1 MAG: Adenylosuccinate lyase [Alphaproteobacteria bacterium MarineAlpha5_Bin6]|tara:strand:- start:1572 stop:2867 length:1296 start_codon:yes stop_codon:yes gene_type:complete
MIPRYTRKNISNIWTDENKFKIWTEIECLIAQKLSLNGTIPKNSYQEIKKRAKFNVKEINKIEKETKHDVLAYIQNVSKYIGKSSKYFHYGVTSSDIIDTAFSIQLKQSCEIIIKEINILLKVIKNKSLKHKKTIMIGRSHGIHAEPITFGLKLATFYTEFQRHLKRLKNARDEISICAISGPVGTYNTINPNVEKYVAKKLKLKPESISTQIIPRDRHAMFFSTIGLLASSIEHMATEIRHLQRTEVSEVEEFFQKKQKGSSSMPHKRNPILSENLTGIARYIRSAVVPAMENITLWHERDISHSSVERIIAPDVTIATDFALSRLTNVIKNLIVYPNNMKKNLEKLEGIHKSQKILLSLIKKNVSRNEAYLIVQSASKKAIFHDMKFEKVLNENKKFKKYISKNELKKIFSTKEELKHIDKIFKVVFKN